MWCSRWNMADDNGVEVIMGGTYARPSGVRLVDASFNRSDSSGSGDKPGPASEIEKLKKDVQTLFAIVAELKAKVERMAKR